MQQGIEQGLRVTIKVICANVVLGTIKLAAGLVGNSYALVADAVESFADCVSSAIVWGGLRFAARPADDTHPYGHGRAESLAALAVGAILLGVACGIALEAVRGVVAPNEPPAPFTLFVLAVVVLVKELLFRIGRGVGSTIGSTSVHADAWHQRSDAITSAIAFVGIAASLYGGPRFVAADEWAAVAASGVIAFNGFRFMRVALDELMDRQPPAEFMADVERLARSVPGVRAVEKVLARKHGLAYHVDMHIEVDPDLTVRDAHALAHEVKDAIRDRNDRVIDVMIHVEPYQPF